MLGAQMQMDTPHTPLPKSPAMFTMREPATYMQRCRPTLMATKAIRRRPDHLGLPAR